MAISLNMCTNCNESILINTAMPCVDCIDNTKDCKSKQDTMCIIYNYIMPKTANKLKFLNLPNGANLKIILERIDELFKTVVNPSVVPVYKTKSGLSGNMPTLNELLISIQTYVANFSTVNNQDTLVKVNALDITSGYLNDKLKAESPIVLTLNQANNKTLTIQLLINDLLSKISSSTTLKAQFNSIITTSQDKCAGNTTAIYIDLPDTSQCVGQIEKKTQIDINYCSATFNETKIVTIGATPKCGCVGSSTTPNYVTVPNSKYCDGQIEKQQQIDRNICSLTYNQINVINTGNINCQCNNQPITPVWIKVLNSEECISNQQYITEKDNNSCSITYNTTRKVSTGINTNCQCNGVSTLPTWTAIPNSLNCIGQSEFITERDTNQCSSSYNTTRQQNTGTQNCRCNGQSVQPVWVDTSIFRCNGTTQERKQTNSNSCYTGLQEQYINTGNTTACQCTGQSTVANYQDVIPIEDTCVNGSINRKQRDINTCSTTFNGIRQKDMSIACGNPPVVANTIPNQIATVGTSFSFQIPANTFIDPQGSTLSFTAINLPQGLTFNSNNRVFSGNAVQQQTIIVQVTATNTLNKSTSTSFTITVEAANNNTITPLNQTFEV